MHFGCRENTLCMILKNKKLLDIIIQFSFKLLCKLYAMLRIMLYSTLVPATRVLYRIRTLRAIVCFNMFDFYVIRALCEKKVRKLAGGWCKN